MVDYLSIYIIAEDSLAERDAAHLKSLQQVGREDDDA